MFGGVKGDIGLKWVMKRWKGTGWKPSNPNLVQSEISELIFPVNAIYFSKMSSILWASTPRNGQKHSNHSSAAADELILFGHFIGLALIGLIIITRTMQRRNISFVGGFENFSWRFRLILQLLVFTQKWSSYYSRERKNARRKWNVWRQIEENPRWKKETLN